MKEGKEEKPLLGSPLFPRLHVNDADKGGPRAPPRNKMALYEQLSVPTSRSNSGSASTLPLSLNNASDFVSSASSSQGDGHERAVFSQFYFSPPMPAHSSEKVQSRSSNGVNLNTSTVGFEWNSTRDANFYSVNAVGHLSSTAECNSFQCHDFSKLKNAGGNNLEEEVGHRAPSFIQPRKNSCSPVDQHNLVVETLPPTSTSHPRSAMPKSAATNCSSSLQLYNASDLHLKGIKSKNLTPGQHLKNQNMDNLKVSMTSMVSTEKPASHLLPKEKTDEQVTPSGQGHHCSPLDDLGNECYMSARLHQEYRSGLPQENAACSTGVSTESSKLEKRNVSRVRRESCSSPPFRSDHRSTNDIDNRSGYHEDRVCKSFKTVDVDRNDDISEASMVESISGMNITADDVVGMIGQQHFWNAKRVIANQQRVFAVQVFELHRLIEVQRLIAGSPNMLFEYNPNVNKASAKASFAKRLPTECVLKPQTMKQKNDSQKQKQSPERADENTVEKHHSLDDIKEGRTQHSSCLTQQSSCGPYSGNAPPAPVATDDKAGPWSFHPPLGNQWLIPVMSASEGLIYKPYAGPFPPNTGFMSPIYGGCGPISLPPLALEGCIPNPIYGPLSTHPHGASVHSVTHPAAHTFTPSTFFPSYCRQILNPVNSSTSFDVTVFPGAQIFGQPKESSTGDVNCYMNSQQQHNFLNHENEPASSPVGKFQATKFSEIQGSTVSNPSVRVRGGGGSHISEGRDVIPLFPTDLVLQGPQTDSQPTSVIRVVPHNPTSATESAARIFQCIQQERQQCNHLAIS